MFDISVQVLCSTSSAMHVRSALGTCIIMRMLILIKGAYYQTQLREGVLIGRRAQNRIISA